MAAGIEAEIEKAGSDDQAFDVWCAREKEARPWIEVVSVFCATWGDLKESFEIPIEPFGSGRVRAWSGRPRLQQLTATSYQKKCACPVPVS